MHQKVHIGVSSDNIVCVMVTPGPRQRTQEDTWPVCEDGGCSAALVARGGGGGGGGALVGGEVVGAEWHHASPSSQNLVDLGKLRVSAGFLKYLEWKWLAIFPILTPIGFPRSSRTPWRSPCASPGSPPSGSPFK